MAMADIVMGKASQDGTYISISDTLTATASGSNLNTLTMVYDLSNYFSIDSSGGSMTMLDSSTYKILFDESFYSSLASLTLEDGDVVTISFGAP